MFEAILDALVDALKTFPFLFLIYIIMELAEHSGGDEKIKKLLSGKFAPAVGSLMSVIPECGFSVMCGRLFAGGLITFGTVLSVFLATSDEGLIVLISSGASALSIVTFIGIKLAYAIAVGMIINALFSSKPRNLETVPDEECSVCHEKSKGVFEEYVVHPFIHALKIFVWIFAVNVCFSLLFELVGKEKIDSFLSASKDIQPLLAALVGLIPNCGSSVVISGCYLNGTLGFGGLLAGLSANAGVGLTVIFKEKKRIKEGVLLIAVLYFLSVLLGYMTAFINL